MIKMINWISQNNLCEKKKKMRKSAKIKLLKF